MFKIQSTNMLRNYEPACTRKTEIGFDFYLLGLSFRIYASFQLNFYFKLCLVFETPKWKVYKRMKLERGEMFERPLGSCLWKSHCEFYCQTYIQTFHLWKLWKKSGFSAFKILFLSFVTRTDCKRPLICQL